MELRVWKGKQTNEIRYKDQESKNEDQGLDNDINVVLPEKTNRTWAMVGSYFSLRSNCILATLLLRS